MVIPVAANAGAGDLNEASDFQTQQTWVQRLYSPEEIAERVGGISVKSLAEVIRKRRTRDDDAWLCRTFEEGRARPADLGNDRGPTRRLPEFRRTTRAGSRRASGSGCRGSVGWTLKGDHYCSHVETGLARSAAKVHNRTNLSRRCRASRTGGSRTPASSIELISEDTRSHGPRNHHRLGTALAPAPR